MPTKLNLIGKIYGKLIVVAEDPTRGNSGNVKWICECSCGGTTSVASYALKSGATKSCGCIHKKMLTDTRTIDEVGNTYGRLSVVSKAHHNLYGVYWKCICECGNTHIALGISLRGGDTKSCGCLKKELQAGANCNWWRGGKTSELSLLRTSAKCQQWRFDVFTRDDFTCQKCKDGKGGNLNAHHLHSFTRYPKYRTVVENGVTLCKKCHTEFHSLYGTKRFTSDDYWEWVK